jgi:hypothetical protein
MVTKIEVIPQDTSKEAAEIQAAVFKDMTVSQRMAITFQLSNNMRSLVIAGIKKRHPEYTDKQIVEAVIKLTVEKELFQKVFPNSTVQT